MPHRAKLGGFKILSDVVHMSAVSTDEAIRLPGECCHPLTRKRINLNFFSCAKQGRRWVLELAVNAMDASLALGLLAPICENPGPMTAQDAAILSIFPHKNDPAIMGELLCALAGAGIRPKGLANSPSALSVILAREEVEGATDALFEPFQFSAYRTPSDWRLAQKGKEQLYKEVIASFQESRPKVYFLECRTQREMVRLRIGGKQLSLLGTFFRRLGAMDVGLGFLSTAPSGDGDAFDVLFCLPQATVSECLAQLEPTIAANAIERTGPVAAFSMNGPHFGDRYGLAGDLLAAFEMRHVELLGLSCSIATIGGVVPAHCLQPAIDTITSCFEVPSIIQRP